MSKANVCLQMLVKKDSEFVHQLIRNYDYVVHKFWLLVWTTLQTNSQHFWKIIRVCEYNNQKFRLPCPQILTMVQKLWHVLVAVVVNLSTKLRPHLYQTPTKRRHLNVEAWFDQTSTTLRSNSDYIFINYAYVFRHSNYLVEGWFNTVVVTSEKCQNWLIRPS